METNNLSPKCIMDFTPEDTIYIQRTSKDSKNSQTFLCRFKEYKGSRVIGTAISTDINPTTYAHEIEQGLELSAHLEKCALYGENPINGRTYFHWFKSSGYAIYPQDYDKESASAEIIKEHPSFGLIRLTRRNSRGTVLFGSSITHNEVISLSIDRGEVDRHLNQEWYHGRENLIEIEFSSNQFAEFITTPNQGSGVPCTIRHFMGNTIPEPPYENTKDKYSREFEAEMKNLASDLENNMEVFKNILEKPTTNKGDKAELLGLYQSFINKMKSTIPFIDKQFVEQMDKTVTEAKGEIEAFITRRLTEEGRKVLLGGDGNAKILLEAPENKFE